MSVRVPLGNVENVAARAGDARPVDAAFRKNQTPKKTDAANGAAPPADAPDAQTPGPDVSRAERLLMKLRTPDMLLLEGDAEQLASQRSEIAELQRLVQALRTQKMGLSTLGPAHYATVLQSVVRMNAQRRRRAVQLPRVTLLNALARRFLGVRRWNAKKSAALGIQTRFRSRVVEVSFEKFIDAVLSVQTTSRMASLRANFKAQRTAAIRAQTLLRGAAARNQAAAALYAATLIATAFRGHAVRRSCVRRQASRFHAALRQTDLLAMVIAPPPGTTMFTARLDGGACSLEGKLEPDSQPFAVKLRVDAEGDVGCFFVVNPRRDLRLILAPWFIRGSVKIVLHNHTSSKNAVFEIDHDSLLLARNAIALQKLVKAKDLWQYHLHASTLILSVHNAVDDHGAKPKLNCFDKAHRPITV